MQRFKYMTVTNPDEETKFLFNGEWSIEASQFPKNLSDETVDFIIGEMIGNAPLVSYAANQGHSPYSVYSSTTYAGMSDGINEVNIIEVDFKKFRMRVVSTIFFDIRFGSRDVEHYLKVVQDHHILFERGTK